MFFAIPTEFSRDIADIYQMADFFRNGLMRITDPTRASLSGTYFCMASFSRGYQQKYWINLERYLFNLFYDTFEFSQLLVQNLRKLAQSPT